MSDDTAEKPPSTSGIVLHFIRWYWIQRSVEILREYVRYASAFGSAFSIIYLLKTFIAPWKSIQDAYPKKGLNITAILETLTLNMTARVVGMVVRTGAMLAGLALQIVLFICFIVYIVLWMTLPLVIIAIAFTLFQFIPAFS